MQGSSKRTFEIDIRKKAGKDGAISRHIIEKIDGKTNSVTHQVIKDGKVIHQHQKYVGKFGAKKYFPDEWGEYIKIKK